MDENNNQFTLYGDVTRNSSENSYSFDGDGDYAVGTTSFIPSTDDFTLEIYLKTPSVISSSSDQAVVSLNADSSNSTGRFKVNLRKDSTYSNGALIVFWNNTYKKTNVFYTYNESLDVDTRYEIQLTRTNNNMYFYVNDVLTNTISIDTVASPAPIAQVPLKIGKFSNNSTQYFKGNIYAIRIYNRALSSTELVDNYNADITNYTVAEEPVTTTHNLYDNIIANDYSASQDGLFLGNDKLSFKGSNPNNYLSIDNETYRIIGTNESKTGFKIIRISNQIGPIAYDTDAARTPTTTENTFCTSSETSGCNAWTTYDSLTASNYSGNVTTEASLNTYLNGEFYNALSTSLKNLIMPTTQNVGSIARASSYDDAVTASKTKTWTGNVALLTVVDLMEASVNIPTLESKQVANNYLTSYGTDVTNYWTCSQTSNNNWDVWINYTSTWISARRASRLNQEVSSTLTTNFYARPVYTIPVDLNVSGAGTSSNPYIYTFS